MTFWFFRWPIACLLHHKPLPFPYEYVSLLYTDWSRAFSFRRNQTPAQNALGTATPKALSSSSSSDHDTHHPFSAFPLFSRLPRKPPPRYSPPRMPNVRRSLDRSSSNTRGSFPFKYNGARSRRLEIQIGNKPPLANWTDAKLSVDRFFLVQPPAAGDFGSFGNLSLDVKWHQGSEKIDSPMGFSVLRSLFCHLANREFRPWPRGSCLLGFRRISMTVPTSAVKRLPVSTQDTIRLEDAVHLKEFHWRGDLCFLLHKIEGLPYRDLSVLSISGCAISILDALNLLRLCPNLTSLALETIRQAQPQQGPTALNGHDPGIATPPPFGHCPQPKVPLLRLKEMKIASDAPLLPLVERIRIGESASLDAICLVLDGAGTRDLREVLRCLLALARVRTFQVRVRGCPEPSWEAERFRRAFPSVRFNSR